VKNLRILKLFNEMGSENNFKFAEIFMKVEGKKSSLKLDLTIITLRESQKNVTVNNNKFSYQAQLLL
jgi:hypothetical protein